MRFGTVLKVLGLAFASLLVLLVAVVKSIDTEAYRSLVVELARQATGRELVIRGDFDLKLSLTPSLVAEDVTFANAPWGSRPEMAKARRVEAQIGLIPLFSRQVQVKRLVIVEPDLLLETNSAGQSNWRFLDEGRPAPVEPEGDAPPPEFRIGEVRIENAAVTLREGDSVRRLRLDRFAANADTPASPVGITAAGGIDAVPFELSGVVGALSELLRPGQPYAVKLKADIGGVMAVLDGSVADPARLSGLDVRATIEGADLARAAILVGLAAPALGPFRASARVVGSHEAPQLVDVDIALGRREGLQIGAKGLVKEPLKGRGIELAVAAETVNLAAAGAALQAALPATGPIKLAGRLGDAENGYRLAEVRLASGGTEATGDATLVLGGPRPMLKAGFSANGFDTGQVTAPRQAPEQTSGKAKPKAARLFPDDPLALQGLRLFDADLSWRLGRLVHGDLVAEDVVGRAVLSGGRLHVSPMRARVAGGSIEAGLKLDAASEVPEVELVLDADKVGLGALLKALGVTESMSGGRIDLEARLQGRGASIRALMAGLGGDLLLISDKAVIDNAYARFLALDVLREIAPWAPRDTATQVQCVVGRFAIKDGMAVSRALLFDTSLMTVGGEGSIDLGSEALHLTLVPRPKEASLVNLATPVDVGGTLAAPTVSPNRLALARNIAGAAAGAAVAGPLALLVPFVTVGSGDANPCVAALEKARAGGKEGAPEREGLGGLLKGIFGR